MDYLNADHFSAREFLRSRRPERFSDSEPVDIPQLDRSMLEYHLETLTSRSQEADFARFALRLAEREICPNLIPQTGPTGGGDSKADAETYPVADGLSLFWYSGVGREAASERWAFAFSSMKKWQPKVRSDVAKIAATGRGYTKAIFISNQYISDKSRAKLQDELGRKHKLDVWIHDRTWLLDKVFGSRHEKLAIDELRVPVAVRTDVRRGPLDLQREAELAEVEARIASASQGGVVSIATVADCLSAAELARSLERPRVEVEGLYARAERLANQHGTGHQQFVCAYQKAWTAFWWHDDYREFARLYGDVERLAERTRNVYELELLHNLWMLLHSSARAGQVSDSDAKMGDRTNALARELDRLGSGADRPSTALQAQTLRLLMRLLTDREAGVAPVLRYLGDVIDRCGGLVGYPLVRLADMLVELGEYLGHEPAYVELFDRVNRVVASRTGEVTAARLLMKRGGQELRADRPYAAIRYLGQSLTRLHKEESRHDAVKALLLCGSAYEQAGLFWAARGSALAAAALAAGDYWTYSELTRHQAASYNRLKWLELRLGRVPQVLAWHEVDRVVSRVMVDGGEEGARLAEADAHFDAILGILFLRMDLWSLGRVSGLPDVLEGLGLPSASVALLYGLGYEELMPAGLGLDPPGQPDLHTLFVRWRDQPAAADLPEQAALYDGVTVDLSSNVLGCRVTVTSDNVSPCVELAESLLAAVEGFAATGLVQRVFAREPVLTAEVRTAELAAEPFKYEVQDRDGRHHLVVRCHAFHPHSLTPEAQRAIRDRLLELLAAVAGRVFFFTGGEKTLEQLVKEELAFDRAVNFTGSFGTVGNVLGNGPKASLSAWNSSQARDYPPKRGEVWDAADRRARVQQPVADPQMPLTPGQGPPPADMFQPERFRHTQMRTVSLIREALWDHAGWKGTAFLWDPDAPRPPILALVFDKPEVGGQIVTQLYNEVGPEDRDDTLRVSVVRRIDKGNPHAYRVVVASNPLVAGTLAVDRMVLALARVNTMEPLTSLNLETFLQHYSGSGRYYLTYAIPTAGEPGLELAPVRPILKTHLHVREAWQVGMNDLDSMGILPDDQPVIPIDVENPPIVELLQWKRQKGTV